MITTQPMTDDALNELAQEAHAGDALICKARWGWRCLSSEHAQLAWILDELARAKREVAVLREENERLEVELQRARLAW